MSSQGRPRAPTRVAGTKKSALFDIVSWDDGQRPTAHVRAAMPRRHIAHPTRVSRASAARHRSRACPRSAVRRRKSGKPDLRGPRGYTSGLRFTILALGPGSRSARASALAALVRDTRARLIRCLLTSPTAPPASGNAAGCAPRARRNVPRCRRRLSRARAECRAEPRVSLAPAAIHQRPAPCIFPVIYRWRPRDWATA